MIHWAEIPVTDFDRAKKFYDALLNKEHATAVMGEHTYGFFQDADESFHGAFVAGEGYTPSATGSLIYITCEPDLTEAQDRVESSGGKLLRAKYLIPGGNNGYMALFSDTEGNTVALHSSK
ncbi:MAG: VOC family protein [Bacteroidota bacterium]